MKEFIFKKMDAFATSRSDGNPAGYIRLEGRDDITDGEMQQIARELKGFVNEVGYITRLNDDTFHLKYFSSEREVEFCGHATIAIMYDIILNTPELMGKQEIYIINNKGRFTVENEVKEKDAVFIMSPEPEFRNCSIPRDEMAAALNISASKLDERHQTAIVNGGLETLIIPIKNLADILAVTPQIEILKSFCVKNKIDIIEVFSEEVYDKGSHYRTRVFAPTFGYLEDPATGSGNSALGYYLMKYGLWQGDPLVIEQNGLAEHFNIVQLKTRMDEKSIKRVMFGGGAVTRIEGNYLLHRGGL